MSNEKRATQTSCSFFCVYIQADGMIFEKKQGNINFILYVYKKHPFITPNLVGSFLLW